MVPEEKIRTTVEIFGTTYRMVGTFSQEYMKRIAAYVNENMETIAKSNPRLDTQRVSVLAMISMADEYFRLQAKWNEYENDSSQSKQRIEELRKAFRLTEEKERELSRQVLELKDRIAKLEEEKAQIAREAELASLAWAERVAEWEAKNEAAVREAERTIAELQARVADLENELARKEAEAAERAPAAQAAAAVEAPKPVVPSVPEGAEGADAALLEKYLKLQEEYAKLQKEFNEWIQLTMSETQ